MTELDERTLPPELLALIEHVHQRFLEVEARVAQCESDLAKLTSVSEMLESSLKRVINLLENMREPRITGKFFVNEKGQLCVREEIK